MTRLLIILAALGLGGCATYADMSKMEMAWQAAHLIDVAQTMSVDGDPCFYEAAQPTATLIGDHPSAEETLVWGVAASVAHAYVGSWIDNSERLPKWSKVALRAVDFGLKVNAVTHNYSIGIRIGGVSKNTHPNRPAYCY